MIHRAAIVAHGQPGNPGPLQRDIEALAERVTALLPGWQVAGGTLADRASLHAAAGAALIYPLFMADGWFVRSETPKRLADAGVSDFRILDPLGLHPDLPRIGLHMALNAASKAGIDAGRAELVVAGHGSGKSPAPRAATQRYADAIAASGRFARVTTGYIEEAPFLNDLRPSAPAICLPFFATRAGHVMDDIPAAWRAVGVPGPICPPVGTDPAIPGLIAAALSAAA